MIFEFPKSHMINFQYVVQLSSISAMDTQSSTCSKSLKEYFQQFDTANHDIPFKHNNTLWKISRWFLLILGMVFLILVIVYNCVFENYEVVGESLECTTNTPFELNYTCKLEIIDNNTQYWSFESVLPDDFSLIHMMVSDKIYIFIH